MNDAPSGSDPVDDGPEPDSPEKPPGEAFVDIRGALVGLVLIWLTAMATFVAIQAAIYGVTVSTVYLLASAVAIAVAVSAASATLRTFGYR